MFGKKLFGTGRAKMDQAADRKFEREEKFPVIRASICTGEKVAGFKDKRTGKFEEVMLVRNEKDLLEFRKNYGIKEEEIRKEW